jgi:hypothetical protein
VEECVGTIVEIHEAARWIARAERVIAHFGRRSTRSIRSRPMWESALALWLGLGFSLSGEPADPQDRAPAWRLVMGRHFQLVGLEGEDPAITDLREGNRGACPVAGMVEVRGQMKQHDALDDLQMMACTTWMPKLTAESPGRCAEYDRDRWRALSKNLRTKTMAFCIDRFEFPNRKGESPMVMVNWHEAQQKCTSQGKRLCREDEWTFACEGEEAMPYPNGTTRDSEACVIDRKVPRPDLRALTPRIGDRAMAEIERLWMGEPSGSHPACRSAFGVHDLIGNVDEWTRADESSHEHRHTPPGERHPSILKGGFWAAIRGRCRPSTRVHGEAYTMFQQGFRCCADVPRASVAR